jgi:ferric-dicitrate binding protein FerR (iron transport regulator)
MSYQERFWVLLSKKLSGEAKPTELNELEDLITDHPEWQYAIQNLEDLWKHQEEKDYQQEEDAYLLHLHRMKEMNIPFGDGPVDVPAAAGSVKMRIRKYWIAAAVVAVLFLSGLFIFKKGNTDDDQKGIAAEVNEISTKPGSKSKVQLPDGTIVLLNAGSQLTYSKEYGKKTREVNLTGEAFFDVKENKGLPFIIHTSHINIKVLGTVFNVKAYPEDKKTEASLIKGKIEVTIKNRPNDKIILSASEKLVVENNDSDYEKETFKGKNSPPDEIYPMIAVNKLKYSPADSSIAEIQWTENKLVFRDESFADLATSMERWYAVKIDLTDPSLADTRLTGIFENETIEQALDALKVTLPFNYEKNGTRIIITR